MAILCIEHVQLYTILWSTLTMALQSFGNYLTTAPSIRLFESLICRRYYLIHNPSMIDSGAIPEQLCKIDAVQDEIAMLNGWQMLFDSIPGLIVAAPLTMLTDIYGRKLMFFISLIGLCMGQAWTLLICYLKLDLRLTWLASTFLLIGGGMEMAGALFLMLIANVTPEEQRATTFFYIEAFELSTGLLSPLIGSILMSRNVWIPMLLGLAIRLLGSCLVFAIPQSKGIEDQSKAVYTTDSCLNQSSDVQSASDTRNRITKYRDTLGFLVANPNIALILLTFTLSGAIRTWLEYFLQYISKRYHWSLAQAGYVLSVRAFGKIIVLCIVLPGVSHFLRVNFKFSAQRKDLYVSRLSSALTCLGFFLIAIAPKPWLMLIGILFFCLGIGFRATTRSLVTSMVDPTQLTSLYTAAAVMDMLGGLVSGPALSTTFRWGLSLGEQWLGVPFIYTALLFMVITSIMMFVRAPRDGGYEPIRDNESDEAVTLEG